MCSIGVVIGNVVPVRHNVTCAGAYGRHVENGVVRGANVKLRVVPVPLAIVADVVVIAKWTRQMISDQHS